MGRIGGTTLELKRALTLRTIISTSAGLTLATASFVALVQMATAVAGDSAWIAVLAAGVLALMAAASFSEMNGMFPSAAAIRVYLHRGFNERTALVVSFLYVLVVVAVLGAESFFLSKAVSYMVPSVPAIVWDIALLILVVGVNLRGVVVSGAFQDVVTYGLMVSLVLVSIIAFTRPGFALHMALHPGGATALLNAIALAVFLFIGFEWVTPLSEEVTELRLVPKGMFLAIGILSVVYALFSLALTSSVGHQALSGTVIPQMLMGTKVLGTSGAVWMLAVSLGASATTFNAGFSAGSRFLYAFAREHLLPKWFARVHERFLTPQNSLLALSGVVLVATVLIYASQHYTLLIDVGAGLESIIYVLVAVAVIRLRRTAPEQPRPWRAPWVPWLPGFTAVAFGVLALGALTQDLWAPVVLVVFAGLCWWYVVGVVPKLQARARAERAARGPRRPRRPHPADGG